MQIVTACPHCGQRYTTEATSVGEIAPCMKCGQKFIISERPQVGFSRQSFAAASNSDAIVQKTRIKSRWIIALTLIVIVIIILIGEQAKENAKREAKREANRINREVEEYVRKKQFEREFPWATEDGLRQLKGY